MYKKYKIIYVFRIKVFQKQDAFNKRYKIYSLEIISGEKLSILTSSLNNPSNRHNNILQVVDHDVHAEQSSWLLALY